MKKGETPIVHNIFGLVKYSHLGCNKSWYSIVEGAIFVYYYIFYCCSYQLWKSTFDASIYFIHEVLSKLKGCAEVFIRFLNQVIELVLCCARTVQIFNDEYDMKVEINHVISPAFHDVSNSMMEYVSRALAGPFGSSLKGMRWSSNQAEYEIKVFLPFFLADYNSIQ